MILHDHPPPDAQLNPLTRAVAAVLTSRGGMRAADLSSVLHVGEQQIKPHLDYWMNHESVECLWPSDTSPDSEEWEDRQSRPVFRWKPDLLSPLLWP